ncbi:hypothetical protein CO683_35900 [Bradyrhizobium ottawaense]|uniref:type VI secretion system-associated FHA domain protein n=1 Tax=Bradyrhizobium ottawaense TaxID=931866 RepID=UPI000BE95120|nr:type VI secretion system-associated FHA domain protein [Bradyrhizobium ottawaense]PDT64840.1 hypothetical protein CO683_35900 [Bradyrhizobium ottawaense]
MSKAERCEMHLILGILGEKAESLGQNARKAFGPEGGSVGRGLGCKWHLPDPTNMLSARHASIAFNGIGFTITDTSTNGVYINTVDAPLGRGNTAPLADGDTLYMASYIISVMIENDPAEERQRLGVAGSNAERLGGTMQALPSSSLVKERPNVPLPGVRPLTRDADLRHDPLMAIVGRQSSYSQAQVGPQAIASPQAPHPSCFPKDVIFGNEAGSVDPNLLTELPRRLSSASTTEKPSSYALLGEKEPPLVASSHRPIRSDGGGAPLSGRPAPTIPDDLDLTGLLPEKSSRGVSPRPSKPRFEAPNETIQVAHDPLGPALTNDLWTLRGLGRLASRPGEYELDRLAGPKEPAALRPVGAAEVGSGVAIETPLLPVASPPDADELQAFWNVLGFNSSLVLPTQRREFFAELARALAEMANGLHSILAAWTMVKNECQIETTRIRADNDNAFKFMKNNHDALREALATDHGVLRLSRSVREGFDDIKAHEVAAIAAMRGAVGNVLTRMSPQRIESDGANNGRFGPRVDKTKLWDRFVELHASMVNDIDRTARAYIAEEFTRSYESQHSTCNEDEGKPTDGGAAKQISSVGRR